jgi:DNA-binding MarR family transcriptional regulator
MSQSAAEARAKSARSGRQPSPQTEPTAGDHTRRDRSPNYAARLHKGKFPPATGPLCARASDNWLSLPEAQAKVATAEDNIPFERVALDNCQFAAYTSNMSIEHQPPPIAPCLCNALRQASRAVSRLYDDELRGVGLRTTQYSLLRVLERAGQVRQRDLSDLTSLDETTLTRNLRPLVDADWIAVRSGDDRREKVVTITRAGTAKLAQARPAWERAQTRMRALLPEGAWQGLMTILPDIARFAAEA